LKDKLLIQYGTLETRRIIPEKKFLALFHDVVVISKVQKPNIMLKAMGRSANYHYPVEMVGSLDEFNFRYSKGTGRKETTSELLFFVVLKAILFSILFIF